MSAPGAELCVFVVVFVFVFVFVWFVFATFMSLCVCVCVLVFFAVVVSSQIEVLSNFPVAMSIFSRFSNQM